MTVSQATARQPSLITPLKKKKPVIGAGLDWRDNKFCHHVRPGVRHLTNDNCSVNAAPCRLPARGEESINVKSSVSPTTPQ